jgi:putative alpha-1,2-mannosidase
MCAFVVFSMLGFYPVTPGVPAYELGSPVFDKVTIRLQNGKTLRLVCKNNSRDNKYIQAIRLNGRPQNRVWFRHADLLQGLNLELEMSNTPNHSLGAAPSSFPPSSINCDPAKLP